MNEHGAEQSVTEPDMRECEKVRIERLGVERVWLPGFHDVAERDSAGVRLRREPVVAAGQQHHAPGISPRHRDRLDDGCEPEQVADARTAPGVVHAYGGKQRQPCQHAEIGGARHPPQRGIDGEAHGAGGFHDNLSGMEGA